MSYLTQPYVWPPSGDKRRLALDKIIDTARSNTDINENGEVEQKLINQQFKDIVSDKVVADYYLKLQTLKKAVLSFYQQSANKNVNDPRVIEEIKRQISDLPIGKDPVLAPFVNNQFVQMTVRMGLDSVRESEEMAKNPKKLDEQIQWSWKHFAADAVISYVEQVNYPEPFCLQNEFGASRKEC